MTMEKAMTDTVTVPREDLAGKLKAIRDKFLMPTPDKEFTDYAVMTRCIEALAAAPKVEQEPDVIIHLEENHTAFGSFPVMASWKNVSRLPAGKHSLYTHPAPASDELLEALRAESWDLRCFNIPTGGDDYNIGWRVVGHWQAEPHERTIAEVYTDDPAAAVRAAIAKHKGPQS